MIEVFSKRHRYFRDVVYMINGNTQSRILDRPN